MPDAAGRDERLAPEHVPCNRTDEAIDLLRTARSLGHRSIERRDGKLPLMNGGGQLPMLTFDVSKLGGNDSNRDKRLRELLEETAPSGKAPAATPAAVSPAPDSTAASGSAGTTKKP